MRGLTKKIDEMLLKQDWVIDAIDIKVFLKIDEVLQQERIKKRNPDKYERFIHEWIPLEQLYFNTYVKVTDYGMTILPVISNR